MKEQLHDCPKCGTKNFTAKGLASHNCAKHAARRDAALAVDAGRGRPGSLPIQRDDAEMGVQITSQYHRAVAAMPEILRFGAMMIRLREHLSGSNAHDGHKTLPKGVNAEDGGVKAWLEKHAPEVKRGTAQRFEGVTLSVMESYAEIVGAKVAKQIALPDLVTSDPAKLAPALAQKQQALFAHVAGTSQKSWLDKFSPPKERGGWQGGRKKEKHTPEEEHAIFLAAAREDFTSALRALDALVMNGHWKSPSITDAELDAAMAVAERFAAEAKAWLKTPKKHRTRADAAGEEDGQ